MIFQEVFLKTELKILEDAIFGGSSVEIRIVRGEQGLGVLSGSPEVKIHRKARGKGGLQSIFLAPDSI